MNNLEIDSKIWEQLRKRWSQLESGGKSLKVDFQLINGDAVKDKTLAVDVLQTINTEIFVETIQRNAGEAYKTLGIVGLSVDELLQTYKKMLHELHRRAENRDADLVVEMVPHSAISGETTGYLHRPETGERVSLALNYQHYYLLNALREKMLELVGDRWSRVKAVYHAGDVEFSFDYQEN